MIYNLPTIRSTMAGFANLATLAERASTIQDDNLTVDFSQCGFFEANMAAPLKVVLRTFIDAGCTIDVTGLSGTISTILRKNEFLREFGHSRMYDQNGTVLPYKHFALGHAADFATYLDTHLPNKGIPVMTEGLGKKFRQSIFEIFQNCVMHSHSNAGIFVCGQYFPKHSRLDLTITDAGVGIRSNVRNYLKNEMSAVEAIRWAMIEGHTTKTGSQPGGFGLKLLQEFIELNKGKVQIASHDGYYEFCNGSKSYQTMRAELPGTTINFEINTDDKKSYKLRSEISTENLF